MYACSVLLRLEKESARGAGAVLPQRDDAPVWAEGLEESLGENQTLAPRWVWVGDLRGCCWQSSQIPC